MKKWNNYKWQSEQYVYNIFLHNYKRKFVCKIIGIHITQFLFLNKARLCSRKYRYLMFLLSWVAIVYSIKTINVYVFKRRHSFQRFFLK